MAIDNESKALAESIGEHCLSAVKSPNLRGISISFSLRTAECLVSIALADNSEQRQLEVLDELIQVRSLFIGEAVISFAFVQQLPITAGVQVQQPSYSYA